MLVNEVLSRPIRDRRAVARYAGLTGAPDESGAKRREQGLAKAGNARVRRGMIQLAWRFLSPCGTNPQAGPFDRRYNKIGGNLLVDANRATTDVSGNSIGGNMECENNNTLTYLDLNSVTGQHQGQCAAFQ